ncbi:Mitochondrial import receptor subunit TOM6 homolog [Striga hermonthica]|uniref:Mitochondrial import receptor subunit TOM6 homolog n=1 Tax=Striga hermonthica TaxID=68872 RepID=A0A9N7R2B3_STRHE|nr:Mitochondrial import receptor subunit TOM6 homolog [Striga hermonthica]
MIVMHKTQTKLLPPQANTAAEANKGMFMRKPDKAAALKQLKSHVAMFGAWVAVVRATPYVLHYLFDQNEPLKLEL